MKLIIMVIKWSALFQLLYLTDNVSVKQISKDGDAIWRKILVCGRKKCRT